MSYKVIVEFSDGYIQSTDFIVLKFALKWMDWLRAHPLRNMESIKLECNS